MNFNRESAKQNGPILQRKIADFGIKFQSVVLTSHFTP